MFPGLMNWDKHEKIVAAKQSCSLKKPVLELSGFKTVTSSETSLL